MLYHHTVPHDGVVGTQGSILAMLPTNSQRVPLYLVSGARQRFIILEYLEDEMASWPDDRVSAHSECFLWQCLWLDRCNYNPPSLKPMLNNVSFP